MLSFVIYIEKRDKRRTNDDSAQTSVLIIEIGDMS